MKVSELLKSKHITASGNVAPEVPQAANASRHAEVDDGFNMLDGTNPEKPYSKELIMKAMKELFRRIERQAAHYGGEIDQKTGKIDRSKHKYYDAQIAPNE
jgi:hypothetical protein